MTQIDRMSALLSSLRQQLATKTNSKSSTELSETSLADSDQPTHTPVESLPALRKRIGRELKRFDLKSVTERRLARQTFVESVLAWDLGTKVSGDSRFGFMIREVEEMMSSDPRTAEDLDALVHSLQQDDGQTQEA